MTPRRPWRRRNEFTTLLMLIGSIIVTFAVLCTAIAHAAPETPQQDGKFLFALGQAGFGYESATPVIVAGHTVCELLDAGGTVNQAAESIMGATGLNRPWSLLFVRISIQAFCGRHGDALRPHQGGSGQRNVGVIV